MRSLFVLVTIAWAAAPAASQPADLVFTNGRIVTVDAELPEAEALAVVGDRIAAVGRAAEIERWISAGTTVIDLGGKLAIPGFVEGHAHFLGVGDAKMQLDLNRVASWDEIIELVSGAVRTTPPGTLIRGRGWHQSKWDSVPEPNVLGVPTYRALSAVSPDHPVVLTHASGHAVFANARAMEMSGVDRDTPDPSGGEVVRDAYGEPIGMFRETASSLLGPAYAQAVPPSMRRQAELAARECVAKGITTFQDAGSSFAAIDLFKEMVDEGAMPLRMWVMLRESNARLAARMNDYRFIDYADHRLTVRAVKRMIDGALGPHGAWLLAPYADLPSSEGLNTSDPAMIEETAALCAKNGFQLCVHAIGDRANREVLDLFERTFLAHPAASAEEADRRWRVEHAQHLNPDDIPRFGALGVVASMQAVHCTSDAVFVPERLGDERSREGAYVWRSLLDSGAVVCNGTDAPVEDVDPLPSFAATVSRKVKDGSIFFPEQCLTREEALASYTLAGAWAAFLEHDRGSLTVGKLADVVVLSRDILRCPADEIEDAEVLMTFVGGKLVFARAAATRAPTTGSGGR